MMFTKFQESIAEALRTHSYEYDIDKPFKILLKKIANGPVNIKFNIDLGIFLKPLQRTSLDSFSLTMLKIFKEITRLNNIKIDFSEYEKELGFRYTFNGIKMAINSSLIDGSLVDEQLICNGNKSIVGLISLLFKSKYRGNLDILVKELVELRCPNNVIHNNHLKHLNTEQLKCMFFNFARKNGINDPKQLNELEQAQCPISTAFYKDDEQCSPSCS